MSISYKVQTCDVHFVHKDRCVMTSCMHAFGTAYMPNPGRNSAAARRGEEESRPERTFDDCEVVSRWHWLALAGALAVTPGSRHLISNLLPQIMICTSKHKRGVQQA